MTNTYVRWKNLWSFSLLLMSAIEPLFPFNELPLELQREIFLVAADVDTASALRLVLVARRVKEW